MQKASVATVDVERFKSEQRRADKDLLAVEEPLEIRIDHGNINNRVSQSISVTMRTPGNDFELAAGFLFTEGIIRHAEDVMEVRYCTDQQAIINKGNIVRVYLHEKVEADTQKLRRNFFTSSSCGICGKESIESVKLQCNPVTAADVKVSACIIMQLPHTLRKSQTVFEYTGGIHAAALFDSYGNILLMREDVGRHNALDKLIGAAIFSKNQSPDLSQTVLLLSGRASFELLQKAVMAGIPVVCAVGAPSSLAVSAAKEFGITLIGFLRDERFNIYNGGERIIEQS